VRNHLLAHITKHNQKPISILLDALSNAFGRALTGETAQSDSGALAQQSERFAPDNVRQTVMITKALGQAGLLDELASLAKPWLDSIATRIGAPA
jgi:hypothetical protein